MHQRGGENSPGAQAVEATPHAVTITRSRGGTKTLHPRRRVPAYRIPVSVTVTRYHDTSRDAAEFQERGAITSESFATVRSSLETRWQRTRAYILATPKHRQHLSETLRKARREITHGFSIHRGWKAIGPGLRQIYSAGQAAIEALSFDDSDEAIHEARKRTKDVQYAAEFLQRARTRPIRTTIDSARHLTDLLGADHDLVVLEHALRSDLRDRSGPRELKRLALAVARRRRSMQRKARAASRTLYAESESALVDEYTDIGKHGASANASGVAWVSTCADRRTGRVA